jgi:5-methylcytosine-specific restriction endonuclease McrA
VPTYIVRIMQDNELRSVPDDELLRRLAEIMRQSRRVEADLVAHIAEVDARRLYARSASPSMFAYATEVLHLSEAEAYLRIAAARASREHPILLAMLADGRLHLTAIAKIVPHLTAENREELLARAAYKSKRQIEELVAEASPRPDVPAVMRKLPDRPGRDAIARPSAEGGNSPRELRLDVAAPGDVRLESGVTAGAELRLDRVAAQAGQPPGPCARPSLGQAPTPAVSPLAPGRYKVQFTASAALRDKLERLRRLMRSSVPDGDLALIIEQAVSEKLERLEALRFARTSKPRRTLAASDTSPRTRQIPAAVRRAVFERDRGQCRFVDDRGRRCSAREGLQFHHRHPFGFGGDHSVGNIALMCERHNNRLAEIDYGQRAMEGHRSSRRTTGERAPLPSPRGSRGEKEPLPVAPLRRPELPPVAERPPARATRIPQPDHPRPTGGIERSHPRSAPA